MQTYYPLKIITVYIPSAAISSFIISGIRLSELKYGIILNGFFEIEYNSSLGELFNTVPYKENYFYLI